MKTTQLLRMLLAVTLSGYSVIATQAQTKLTVKTDQPIAQVQPTMWGIFFEDINFAADGGALF